MPLVQDRSLDLLTSSAACYHCTTDAPLICIMLVFEIDYCILALVSIYITDGYCFHLRVFVCLFLFDVSLSVCLFPCSLANTQTLKGVFSTTFCGLSKDDHRTNPFNMENPDQNLDLGWTASKIINYRTGLQGGHYDTGKWVHCENNVVIMTNTTLLHKQ